MRTSTLILLAICALFCADQACAAVGSKPEMPTATVQASSAAGVSVGIEFPHPTLRALDRDAAGQALYVDIPGTVPDFDEAGIALPTITKFIAVPDGYQAVAHVRSAVDVTYDAETVVPRDKMERSLRNVGGKETPVVEVGEAGWMRWMHLAPVAIHPARYDAASNKVMVAEHLDVDFEFVPDPQRDAVRPPDSERYWSAAFEEFFRGMLLNPEALPGIWPGGRMVTRGSYIIVCDSALARVTGSFANWKREKGFDVVVKPWYHAGLTAETLRDSIKFAYENWDRPPEYVLLLGDLNAPGIQMPSFSIQNPGTQESDFTDLPYTLMTGDDYFPDLFIGRISADSPSPSFALTALGRVVTQETQIGSFPVAKFHRATIFAGNFGDGGALVYSPVETSDWLAHRLLERGWNVDTFFYRKNGDINSPDPIVASINRGANIVSYRGWADGTGPHYPEFHIADINRLTNGFPLPIWTFFVCYTGAFGDPHVNPCFGEAAIAAGNLDSPHGALTFLGASDLHTNTRFNNSLLGGYYYGMMYQDMRTLGALALRSKMELWTANPAYRAMGGDNYYVQFYFSVYNILGDPEVSVYFDAPTHLNVQAPQHLAIGESSARFVVTTASGDPVKGALIHLVKGNETNCSILTDADGVAQAPLTLLTADSLQVTVIANQCAPYRGNIAVAAADRQIGLDGVVAHNGLGDSRLVPNTPIDLTVSLKNFGSQTAFGVTATLSSPLDGVVITQPTSNYGDITAGHTGNPNEALQIRLDALWNGYAIPFVLDAQDNAHNHYLVYFRLSGTAAYPVYQGYSVDGGSIEPGETKALNVLVANEGGADIAGVTAQLVSFDEAVTIGDDRAVFGDIAQGQVGNCAGDPFHITIREGTAIGRQIAMRMALYDNETNMVRRLFFNVTVGRPGVSDPVGPDGYGYYSYDEGDTRYNQHPAFSWIELDPNFEGRQGAALHNLADDSTFGVDLPFAFKFYGHDYHHLSICSNGWVSLENTTVSDFTNWPIPSPLGPHTMLCPFWEDLVGQLLQDSTRAPIRVLTFYDNNLGMYIVEWSRAVARSGDVGVNETFEMTLYNPAVRQTASGNGDILFQYLEAQLVDRGKEFNYATIGIENWIHDVGLQLSYAGSNAVSCDSIKANRAILITTSPPDNFNGVGSGISTAPATFQLGEPYPNPFNSRMEISYGIQKEQKIELAIFGLDGRVVRTLYSGQVEPGMHKAAFDAAGLPAGIYLVRLKGEDATAVTKATLLK